MIVDVLLTTLLYTFAAVIYHQSVFVYHAGIVSLIVLGVTVALTVAMTAYMMMSQGSQGAAHQDDAAPATMDSLNMTQVREGTTVALTYGTVKLAGNLIWYGNFRSKAQYQESSMGGGKGMGGGGGGGTQRYISGYKYYIDAWQAICHGKVSLETTYVADKERTVSANSTTWNDGTMDTYSDRPGDNANRLLGVAHIFWYKWYLGKNKTYMPTVHYVVQKELDDTVITNANHADGSSNPAAIIYDLMVNHSGFLSDDLDIDEASFQAAADYWEDRDYGLNLVFNSQMDFAQMVRKVLGYVDGILYQDLEGQWKLNPYDPTATGTVTLSKSDFLDFKMARPSYEGTPNVFIGNYTDKDMDYTRRSVAWRNDANVAFVGEKRKTIDLSGFHNLTIASKRIAEIGKRLSYPAASIEFTTNLGFHSLELGDVIGVSHSDYGIVSMAFRVVSVSLEEIDKNQLKFKAIQQVEAMFDDEHWTSGGSAGSGINTVVTPFVNQRLFELPFSRSWGHDPAFLVLAARIGEETGLSLMFSYDNVDYNLVDNFSGFSQHGTLDEAYPIDTKTIDDENGILYTPTREDPEFATISRSELFATSRVIIINDEMMTFQTVTPEGDDAYRLTGIIRNRLHTPRQAHSVDDDVWITNISMQNILPAVKSGDFYVKFVPYMLETEGEAASATAIHVTTEWKGKTPWGAGRLVGVRTGTSLALTIWPYTQDYSGSGTEPEDSYTDQGPEFPHEGDFELVYGSTTEYTELTQKTITIPVGATTVVVKMRNYGMLSRSLTLSVGAGDGTYIANQDVTHA